MPDEENKERWELYDLSRDKGECNNLAQQQNDVLKELIEAWYTYEAETGLILPEDTWSIRFHSALTLAQPYLRSSYFKS